MGYAIGMKIKRKPFRMSRKKGCMEVLTRHKAHGAECTFYKINQKGLKCYLKRKFALFAMRKQCKLWKCGLAPEVLSDKLFRVEFDTFEEIWDQNWNGGCKYKKSRVSGWAYWTQLADTKRNIDSEEFRVLENKLSQFGLAEDLHDDNVGYIGDKLVLIDTGIYSSDEYMY